MGGVSTRAGGARSSQPRLEPQKCCPESKILCNARAGNGQWTSECLLLALSLSTQPSLSHHLMIALLRLTLAPTAVLGLTLLVSCEPKPLPVETARIVAQPVTPTPAPAPPRIPPPPTLEVMDSNHDGLVSEGEFSSFHSKRLSELFTTLDRNHDGSLEAVELSGQKQGPPAVGAKPQSISPARAPIPPVTRTPIPSPRREPMTP